VCVCAEIRDCVALRYMIFYFDGFNCSVVPDHHWGFNMSTGISAVVEN